jgi:hypothetical protein
MLYLTTLANENNSKKPSKKITIEDIKFILNEIGLK